MSGRTGIPARWAARASAISELAVGHHGAKAGIGYTSTLLCTAEGDDGGANPLSRLISRCYYYCSTGKDVADREREQYSLYPGPG